MAYTGSVPDIGPRRHDWMADMACRDEDPDLFFDKADVHSARLVCAVRCRVRAQCLANVKEAEQGLRRTDRDGVVAGLSHTERWRLDPTGYRCESDAPLLVLDGTEPCGTVDALLGHLWRGERVDPECWSAEVRRARLERLSAASKRHVPVAEAS